MFFLNLSNRILQSSNKNFIFKSYFKDLFDNSLNNQKNLQPVIANFFGTKRLRKMTDVMIQNGANEPASGVGKTNKKVEIEKIYQKKTQLEHILLRPDTYIGSVERVEQEMWIWDIQAEKMVKKNIKYVPGLFKIFDEILGNLTFN